LKYFRKKRGRGTSSTPRPRGCSARKGKGRKGRGGTLADIVVNQPRAKKMKRGDRHLSSHKTDKSTGREGGEERRGNFTPTYSSCAKQMIERGGGGKREYTPSLRAEGKKKKGEEKKRRSSTSVTTTTVQDSKWEGERKGEELLPFSRPLQSKGKGSRNFFWSFRKEKGGEAQVYS